MLSLYLELEKMEVAMGYWTGEMNYKVLMGDVSAFIPLLVPNEKRDTRSILGMIKFPFRLSPNYQKEVPPPLYLFCYSSSDVF